MASDAAVDAVARTTMAAWEKAEGKPVNVSYVATHADMARAVLDALPDLLRDDSAAGEALRERLGLEWLRDELSGTRTLMGDEEMAP